MNKHKIAALAFALVMTAGVFAGCNNKDDNPAGNAVSDAGETVSKVTDGAGNVVSDVADGVGDAVSDVADGAGNVVSDITEGISDAMDGKDDNKR